MPTPGGSSGGNSGNLAMALGSLLGSGGGGLAAQLAVAQAMSGSSSASSSFGGQSSFGGGYGDMRRGGDRDSRVSTPADVNFYLIEFEVMEEEKKNLLEARRRLILNA